MVRNGVVVGLIVAVLLVSAHFLRPRRGDSAYTFAIVVPYRAGDIYSIRADDGYKICKILVVDGNTVHLRVYKNSFSERPVHVDLSTLSLGTIEDPNGFGIGHMPLAMSKFAAWQPELVAQGKVTQDELEGYEEWKKANGGVFGN